MSEEYSIYDEYRELKDRMITRNIDYIFRWKVMMIKLLLNDITELMRKHNMNLQNLYDETVKDAEEYLNEWAELLRKRRKKIMEVIEVGK